MHVLRSVGLCVLALGLLGAPARSAEPGVPGAVSRLQRDVAATETRVATLVRDFTNPIAQTLVYAAEKRIVDARVFLEYGAYAKAAALFLDVVENPRYRGFGDRPEALFLLGRALFDDHNDLAARHYLMRLVDPPNPQWYQEALRYLVEIALRRNDTQDLERFVQRLAAVAPASRGPELSYVLGKALFQQNRFAEADQAFAAVPAESPLSRRASYHRGVLRARDGRFAEALALFQSIPAPTGAEPADREFADLVHMAIGRLYNELGETLKAVDAYQDVPRDSALFERSLYEMSWAYLNAREFARALDTLQVLMLNANDETIVVQAAELHGRLGIYLEKYDEALDAYQSVVDRFSQVRNELNAFTARPDSIEAYFRSLLARGEAPGRMSALLSERVAAWVESSDEMRSVVATFSEVSRTRIEAEEGLAIARRLRAALSAANRIDLFENLRDGWNRTVELESALLTANGRALDQLAILLAPVLPAEGRAAFDDVRARRRALEENFLKQPRTAPELVERAADARGRLAAERKRAFEVETQLKLETSRLLALERFVRASLYGDEREPGLGGQEERFLQRLTAERGRIEALQQRIAAVAETIEQAATAVGAADPTGRSEAQARSQLLASQRAESRVYLGLLDALPADSAALAAELFQLFTRVDTALRSLRQVADAIDRSAAAKASETLDLVVRHARTLDQARQHVTANEAEAVRLGREVGGQLIENVRRRLADVVLDADLGLIDLTWARKQSKSDQIRALNVERDSRLKALETSYQAVTAAVPAGPADADSPLLRALPPEPAESVAPAGGGSQSEEGRP